jgi:hypothetical protein
MPLPVLFSVETYISLVVGLIVTELLLNEIPPVTLNRFIRVHDTPRLVVR